jgi:DNA modification methylase
MAAFRYSLGGERRQRRTAWLEHDGNLDLFVWHYCRSERRGALSQLAWTHETLLWAGKRGSRHTFNYDLINSRNPSAQLSSVWFIPSVPKKEKLHGYHPTQKPLRLVRRAILASSREGDLVFDPFCGSGTTGVAAKELGRFFVGAEKQEEYAKLAERRIGAAERGGVLRELPDLSARDG